MLENKRHVVDLLFIIILAGAFAISATLLVILGANVYKKTVANNEIAYDTRTASLYFNEKLHQADQLSGIRLDTLSDESQALVLSERAAGQTYETWIFLAADQLKEATVRKGTKVTDAYGQPVLSLSALHFDRLRDNLLQVTSTSENGTRSQIQIHLNSSKLEVKK